MALFSWWQNNFYKFIDTCLVGLRYLLIKFIYRIFIIFNTSYSYYLVTFSKLVVEFILRCRYQCVKIWCHSCRSMGTLRGRADTFSCIGRQICATSCILWDCCTSWADPGKPFIKLINFYLQTFRQTQLFSFITK